MAVMICTGCGGWVDKKETIWNAEAPYHESCYEKAYEGWLERREHTSELEAEYLTQQGGAS